MQQATQHLQEALRQAGLKATPQRTAVFAELTRQREHLSAEQVYKAVAPAVPGLSLATVYKIMDSLCQAKLAWQVFVPGGAQHFEAAREDHHHLYCNRTQTIADHEDPQLTRLIEQYLERHAPPGFSVSGFTLSIEGEFENPN